MNKPNQKTIEYNTLVHDFTAHLRGQPLSQNTSNHFLVACMPKSGSTWLNKLIAHTVGASVEHLVTGYDAREQELAVDKLITYHQISYTAQNHLKYSQPTHMLIEYFNLKTVVLYRNLFDVVQSLLDFIPKLGDEANSFNGYMKEKHTKMPKEDLLDFIIEYGVSWYIHFYLSWQNASVKHITVMYDDLLDDTEGTLKKIMDFHNVDVSEEQIKQAIKETSKIDTRKNKAVAGRGDGLSDEVKDKIRLYTRFYPDEDFSLIGL